MLDYDREADHYDRTRGGLARAEAAAAAVSALLPGDTRDVLDIAGGTGIVSACVEAYGHRVIVLDRSHGMLRKAVARLPGRALRADATGLPIASESVDAVVAIWLLHLVPDAEPFVAEAARVLRPGGAFLTTVDKNGTQRPDASDSRPRISELTAAHGLREYAERTFVGHGQKGDPLYTVRAFAKI